VVAAAAPDARSSCALTAVSDHSGLSANRAGVLNAQSWRLIIVWLEVRVLPPRSPAQTANGNVNESLACETPKLTAIASSVMDSQSFGALLDRAIERSQRPMKLIEAAPATVSPEVMQKPFARMRKEFKQKKKPLPFLRAAG
jgi:hypothetical protein